MDGYLAHAPILQLRRSTLLCIFFAIGHAGALVGAGVSALAPWPALGVGGVVLLSWLRTLRHWRNGRWGGGETFRICEDGTWLQLVPPGRAQRYRPTPPHFVHPWLMVIRLRAVAPGHAKQDLVLLPDSLPPDTARRLRVWLRLGH